MEFLEKLEKEIKSLDDIKTGEFIEELSLLHSQGIETLDFTDISGYIKSRLSLYHHINNMVNNAKSEIVISCSAEELFNTYKNIFNSLKEAKIIGGTEYKILKCDKCSHEVARSAS